MSDWYDEQKAKLAEEQAEKSREQIATELKSEAETVFDPENAPLVKHNWIKRGIKMSCEGASHPFHQTWLPRAEVRMPQ